MGNCDPLTTDFIPSISRAPATTGAFAFGHRAIVLTGVNATAKPANPFAASIAANTLAISATAINRRNA
jgi:hypothetical protein